MIKNLLIVPIVLANALLFAACGSAATSSTHLGTKNLIVTSSVRKSLLDADAAYHSLPASDYVGLARGTTYYAFDPQNDRYYAAAGLVANSKSLQAQVGTQDDGAYNLFTKKSDSAKWTVYNDGLGGAEDSICPIVIPAPVRKVWNWTMHPCYPNA
ncbi:MAG: hypothetical protein ACLPKZ_05340 [Acidimicrobiales bacterium]